MASPSMEERLGQFWVFAELAGEELAQVAKLVKEKTFRGRDIVFHQGDQPDFFYLVEQGAIQETAEEPPGQAVLRRRAERGDFVGRYSLLHNTVRRATAIATRDTQVLAINAADFKALLAAFPKLLDRLRRIQVVNRLLATPLFSIFTEQQLFHVADLARIVEYPAGEIIYRQEEQADAFFVIDTGQVLESVSGSRPGGQIWPKYLTAGHFFGRRDLLNAVPRRATAEAVTEVHLFRFNADAFHWLCKLQPAFGQALDRPDILGYLKHMSLFSRLSSDELKELAGYVGLAHLPAGEILYRQGEMDPTLYFLYEGEAVIRLRDEKGRERPIDYLRPGFAVGERSLLLRDPRDATVEPVVSSSFFYLTHEDLDQFLEKHPGVQAKLAPKGVVRERQKLKRFSWMDPDEVFVLRERRHWFFVVNRLILPAFLVALALVLLVLDLLKVVAILALAGAGLWVIWRFIDWTNDYYILTTKRVAHREKVLGVRESRDETPLDKIQNMNIERGFWGNIVDFGTLIIDTAAAAGVTRVTFDYLGEPEQVQSKIFEQVARHRAGERLETRQVIRDRLEQSIGSSIRPVVPRPAIPRPEGVPSAPPGPGILQQTFRATLGRWFWIQKSDGDRTVWRKHWIRLLAKIWTPALFLSILVLALAFLLSWTERPGGVIAIMAVFLLPGLGWFWWNWENWGNDLYVVSNDRIIDIEALPLGFRSRATETTFDRIQNISYDIPNPIATLLNYGTVVIYTAGAEGRLDFQYVSSPKDVQAEIFRRVTAYEMNQRREQRRQQWEELPQWFAAYEEIRRP